MEWMKLMLLLIPVAFAKNDELADKWKHFREEYNKKYPSSSEEDMRMKIFQENKRKIDEHNYNYEKGKTSFTLKMNQFGDMALEEFLASLNSLNGTEVRRIKADPYVTQTGPTPDRIDWRRKGAVTPVKDQSNCGISSAYSVTGSLEGQNFLKTGKLVQLSEQNLIDCLDNEGRSWGTDKGFEYVKGNHGIDTAESYPNTCSKGEGCKFNKSTIGTTCKGHIDLPSGDESALKAAVGNVGPISVTLDASHLSFQFYHKGLYEEPDCKTNNPSHSALVVGYNDDEGAEYWLIKNSWGYEWGIEGFMKLARNKKNHCGIASMASYPEL